jgi:hypothetical protein
MTEEILHNPIAESYWRAIIVAELEQAKGQFVCTESEAWAYDKAITIAKGIK